MGLINSIDHIFVISACLLVVNLSGSERFIVTGGLWFLIFGVIIVGTFNGLIGRGDRPCLAAELR